MHSSNFAYLYIREPNCKDKIAEALGCLDTSNRNPESDTDWSTCTKTMAKAFALIAFIMLIISFFQMPNRCTRSFPFFQPDRTEGVQLSAIIALFILFPSTALCILRAFRSNPTRPAYLTLKEFEEAAERAERDAELGQAQEAKSEYKNKVPSTREGLNARLLEDADEPVSSKMTRSVSL